LPSLSRPHCSALCSLDWLCLFVYLFACLSILIYFIWKWCSVVEVVVNPWKTSLASWGLATLESRQVVCRHMAQSYFYLILVFSRDAPLLVLFPELLICSWKLHWLWYLPCVHPNLPSSFVQRYPTIIFHFYFILFVYSVVTQDLHILGFERPAKLLISFKYLALNPLWFGQNFLISLILNKMRKFLITPNFTAKKNLFERKVSRRVVQIKKMSNRSQGFI